MPARGTATNRQIATDRQLAVGRLTASGRLNVDGSGGGGAVDDMTFLDETVVGVGGAANITFSTISGSYRHLMVLYVLRCDNASNQNLRCQFNADTGSNYDRQILLGSNTTVQATQEAGVASIACGFVTGTGAPADTFATGQIFFPYYSTTTQDKGAIGSMIAEIAGPAGNTYLVGGIWRTANAAVTSIVIFPATGNFVQNSRASLYGIT